MQVMQILFPRCCGIDVHKDSVTACVLVYRDGKEPDVRKKEFATHFKALLNLKQWLLAQKVTHVAMESTGVYWKPVWQALEGSFQLILANPFQIKVMPGRKTDARDSQRIAELLAHGLIKPSFVPPQETRQLRDLTRYRVKLVEQRNRVHNHYCPKQDLTFRREGEAGRANPSRVGSANHQQERITRPCKEYAAYSARF